jgi:hypothetical protein
MKTKILQISSVVAILLMIGACAKENSGSSGGGSQSAQTYVLSNGICYATATCQQVQYNLCANQQQMQGNGLYTMYGGRCYNSAQQEVNPSLCTQNAATQCSGYNGGLNQQHQYQYQPYPQYQYPQYQYQQQYNPGLYFYYGF